MQSFAILSVVLVLGALLIFTIHSYATPPKRGVMDDITSITINDKTVFTNKTPVSISGTTIRFSDGSSCDVASGHVENKGDGLLSFEHPEGASMKYTEKTYTFSDADKLVLDGLSSSCHIETYDGTEVVVTLKGTQAMIDRMNATQHSRSIKLSEQRALHQSTFHASVRISGNQTVISNGIRISSSSNKGLNIVIASGGATSPEVTIRVPHGTHLKLNQNKKIRGSGTFGHVDLKTDGTEPITLETVRSLTGYIGGVGTVTVDSISEYIDITSDGTGALLIKRGNVTSTKLRADGVGTCTFNGTTKDAVITIDGNGNVKMGTVTKQLTLHVDGVGGYECDEANGMLRINSEGTGHVRIRQGNVSHLIAHAEGIGSIEFGGSADEADITVEGVGNVRIHQVKKRPRITRDGIGEVMIGNW